MQTSNNVLAFLQEFIARLSIKSPTFFKVIGWISGALVLITGIPQLLSLMNIHLPEEMNNSLTTAIGWASRGTLLISLLTTQSKPAAIKESTGEVLKITDNSKLPFTEKSENKASEKVVLPVVAETGITKATENTPK